MGQRYRELPATEAVTFAFDHVEELARLLHAAGHRDMALLLDAFGDLRELSLRRAAKGETESLIGSGSDTLDYAVAQMTELAELMTKHGAHDAAVLFRTPGQLRAAAETRRFGVGLPPCSNEAPAERPFQVQDLKLSVRRGDRARGEQIAYHWAS